MKIYKLGDNSFEADFSSDSWGAYIFRLISGFNTYSMKQPDLYYFETIK